MARTAIVCVLIIIAASAAAHAQDHGTFGIVIAFPQAVGAQWHVSERVALRPDFAFSFNGNESTSRSPFGGSSTSSSDGKSIGIGASALFYVKQWDALRAYVSPRFGYVRATATTDAITLFPAGAAPGKLRNLNSTYVTSGSIGAQYALGRRFSIFSEVGLSYSDLESSLSTDTTTQVESSGWSVGSRAGVGVVVYF